MSKENKSGSTASLHQQFGKDDLETDQVESNEASSAELLDHASYQELQKQLTEAEEKASQSWERLLRMQAETENMQRRVERDIADAHKYALKKFTMELLPVVDSLERALAFHIENQAEASMLDGVSLTLKMLLSAMEKFGIEQIDPIGKPFNPDLHQAVSAQDDPQVAPGIVINVLQKGYLLNKQLVRPSMVVVAK